MTPEEKEYDLLIKNVRELMKTTFGRDFVWKVLSICDIYGSKFTGNSTTFFLEGKTAVGLEVLGILEDADITAYPRLLLEKQKKEVSNG